MTGRQGVGIGARADQPPDDRWAAGEVAGPVSDKVQRRAGAAAPADESGRRQRWVVPQQSLDRLDVACVNRRAQLYRCLVVARDPLAGLLAHRVPSCREPGRGE
jgi:hypothetical protein